VGLVLGSGAARGWAHVGVLRGLEEAGIRPQLVCGSSIGAVIAALYAAGRLDAFADWGRSLELRELLGYFDLTWRGGLIKARRVFDFLTELLPDRAIEELPLPFAATATDLYSGQEVWLREGSLVDALRASSALPGLVTPVPRDGRWLVDGGLVNPVPVSLCRAMGADSVVAVDLNTTLLGRRAAPATARAVPSPRPPDEEAAEAPGDGPTASLRSAVRGMVADLRSRLAPDEENGPPPPSIYEVVANSINIMQVRITRSRMAGDPPELLVAPRLEDFGLFDFDRAADGIDEGRRAVTRVLSRQDEANGA